MGGDEIIIPETVIKTEKIIYTLSVNFSSWKEGEPNYDSSRELCVEMYSDGKWNDADCSKLYRFVCERKAVTKDGRCLKAKTNLKHLHVNLKASLWI